MIILIHSSLGETRELNSLSFQRKKTSVYMIAYEERGEMQRRKTFNPSFSCLHTVTLLYSLSISHARIKEISWFIDQGGIMFLKQKSSGDLIEVLQTQNLYDPFKTEILGQSHAGEEMQDPEMFLKSDLLFPSDEPLPRCWLNSDYKHLLNKQSRAVVM
jgi:hypothetical protein